MKQAISVLWLFLMVASSMAGTIRDSFDGDNMDSWIYEIGLPEHWRLKNGQLILESNGTLTGYSIGEFFWKDYTVGVKAKLTKHQAVAGLSEMAGLIVRGKDTFNFFLFGIGTLDLSARQAQAYYFKDGKTGGFKFIPFDWEMDTWYSLKVDAKDNSLKFYIDNELMFEYISELFPTGKVGLGIGNSVSANFDDFFVTGGGIPDAEIQKAVFPQLKLATSWCKIKYQ